MIHISNLMANLEAAYLRDAFQLARACPAAYHFFRDAETDPQQWLHLRSFITPIIPEPGRVCKECKRPL